MTIHKILSLLSFFLIISGCAPFNKEPTSNSLESNLSVDLVEKTDMEDALPNSSENCVPKTGSIFGLSRTCKSSRSLFYNPLSTDKIDSPTDAAIRKNDQKDHSRSDEKNRAIASTDYLTDAVYYSLPRNIWSKLTKKEKSKAKQHNSTHRKKR